MGNAVSREKRYINNIPAIIWGEESNKAYIYVHGKMSYKESAEKFAKIADKKGYQTISFDLPKHGERSEQSEPCDIWNGRKDLLKIAKYSWERWNSLSLYACSLGAHFSLYSYPGWAFKNCLFQSPIVNIDYLVDRLFEWYQLSEDILRDRKVIETPLHTLTWEYYMFIRENPVSEWKIPTSILYAQNDGLQSRQVMEEFAQKYNCNLTIANNCNHGFDQGNDKEIEKEWLERVIEP